MQQNTSSCHNRLNITNPQFFFEVFKASIYSLLLYILYVYIYNIIYTECLEISDKSFAQNGLN